MGTWQHLLHEISRYGAFGYDILSAMYWIKMQNPTLPMIHRRSNMLWARGGCRVIDDEKCYFGGEINCFVWAGRQGTLTICSKVSYTTINSSGWDCREGTLNEGQWTCTGGMRNALWRNVVLMQQLVWGEELLYWREIKYDFGERRYAMSTP